MISKITLKSVLISALFAISALAAYLAFFGESNRTYLAQAGSYIGIQETNNFQKYNLGDIPISLGKIEKDKNAYFHLKLRFRTDGIEGHPNLLQTAPLNKGLRIEFNGSTAAIIVADSNEKEGYRAIILSNAINIGAAHELEIEALNAGYVRALLDGHNAVDVSSSGISMEVSQFLVGGGFDNARVFRGQVDNISIKKGNLSPSIAAIARNIPNTLYTSHAFVSLIANAAILISILLCFFINRVIKASSWVSNYFHSLDRLPIAAIVALVCFQILLMLELPAYRNVAITYFFLFLIGVNQYVALTPSFLKERFFYYLFIPFNGLIFLAVLGSYFIGFSIDIKFLVPTLLCITFLGYLINYRFNRKQFVLIPSQLKADFSKSLVFFTLIVTPLICCLIYPVLLSDHATSPHHIGPDLATYSRVAQYLLDGGTWAKANMRADEFTGMSIGEFNRYADATMSWPLMYHFRWGLTIFQTTVTTITFSKHIFETAFISLLIPYLFLCGLVLFWLKKRAALATIPALLGIVAFSLNPNLINIWYEGFYGHIFLLCFFILILLVFIETKAIVSYTLGNLIQTILFLSIVFAACLVSYGEGIVFVLFPILTLVFIFDLFRNGGLRWAPYLVIFASACIGLVIVLPCNFIVDWAIFTYKQFVQSGGNGYMQPLWALPNEILGFSNVYLDSNLSNIGMQLSRTNVNLTTGIVLSCIIVYSLYIYFRNKSRDENTLYMASIILVIASAYLAYYRNPDNNYTYMKMYMFLLPVLFIAAWSSLALFHEKYLVNILSKNYFFLFLTIPIVLNGMIYIFQYKNEATLIDQQQISLHDAIKRINFDNVIMLPVSMHRSEVLYKYMYPAILPTPWMMPNSWNSSQPKENPYFKNFLKHKVYLFIEKELDHSYELLNGKVIFQNQFYLIIDSGKLVADGINGDANSISFDTYTRSVKESIGSRL